MASVYYVIAENVSGRQVEPLMIEHDDARHHGEHTAMVDVNVETSVPLGQRYDVVCPKCAGTIDHDFIKALFKTI